MTLLIAAGEGKGRRTVVVGGGGREGEGKEATPTGRGRNLVVDITNFYNQYKSCEPWLKRKNPPQTPRKKILQGKEDMNELNGIYECILCACSSTSCPSDLWNPESYLDLAALLHANQ
ncbi:unnamed protein product [Fraxinus pennsylvanica]|uniref:Uncharacterized protein n=1 Tax=Fraxinus pennsylvanica TaxID=56036 RepID=A0AAD1ZED3_9LAMI|nr:unnamed protein product [Fraxinus pennsylvanica]